MKRWALAVGLEDVFAISDEGDVFSVRTEKPLKTQVGKTGYKIISTYIGGRGGKAVTKKVHRLVAEAFLENTENKPHVNHIDGDKLNNNVDNLEWCTPKENSRHAYSTGLASVKRGVDNHLSRFSNTQVEDIRKRYKPYSKVDGTRALAREYGVAHSTIRKILSGDSY